MIYSYLKHNLFWRYFFLGHTCLKPINGRIDKMAVFFSKVCPEVELKGQIEKKSSVGATGEEIFRFNWRNGHKLKEVKLPKEHLQAYTDE